MSLTLQRPSPSCMRGYGDQNDKDNNIYYRILKTTFYEGGPEEITGLHTEALGVLFPVDSMDSCEEMMIQDWPGALYKKDDTAFLCWTYSPEVTYVLEYTPSKIDDSKSSRWLKVQNL